jgi:hypothetical protein
MLLDGIQELKKLGDGDGVSQLAKHAAVLAEGQNDLRTCFGSPGT